MAVLTSVGTIGISTGGRWPAFRDPVSCHRNPRNPEKAAELVDFCCSKPDAADAAADFNHRTVARPGR